MRRKCSRQCAVGAQQTCDGKTQNMKDGIININKPAGMTSHDVIGDLRRLLGMKKIGHTGTLDPMATGVLPICLGKAPRVAEYMDMDFKTYRCTMSLGVITDTQDIWGEVLELRDTANITEAAVRAAFAPFQGEILQLPPMYSAVRIDGRRLYDYARAGETDLIAERVQPRRVYIRNLDIELMDFAHDSNIKKVTFVVECSKGTYIRTICQDVGQTLGCGAAMESLCRVASGVFHLEDAVSLDALIDAYSHRTYKENGRYTLAPASEVGLAEIAKLVQPMDMPLTHFGTALLEPQLARKFTDGWHIALRECEITENPRYRYREPEFEIRPAYRGAYKMYEKNPAMPDGRRFLGVAFYHHQYKKLVADKVFLRSEEL